MTEIEKIVQKGLAKLKDREYQDQLVLQEIFYYIEGNGARGKVWRLSFIKEAIDALEKDLENEQVSP